MANAANMTLDSNMSFLFKGPNGFGKTIAACSMAVEGPVFLAYWDKKKPIELLNFYKQYRPDILKNIDYEVYGSNNANEYLNQLIKWRKEGTKYIGIVTDSVTFMTGSVVGWSMGFRPSNDNVTSDGVIAGFDDYKSETGFVVQALDITRNLPCHNIWTAHPIPRIKIDAKAGGTGVDRISQVTAIVSYGNKVGGIIPGAFSEIYHFAQSNEYTATGSKQKRVVLTDMVGDDYAKSSLGLPKELDISDGKLFWEVWKSAVKERIALLDFKNQK